MIQNSQEAQRIEGKREREREDLAHGCHKYGAMKKVWLFPVDEESDGTTHGFTEKVPLLCLVLRSLFNQTERERERGQNRRQKRLSIIVFLTANASEIICAVLDDVVEARNVSLQPGGLPMAFVIDAIHGVSCLRQSRSRP